MLLAIQMALNPPLEGSLYLFSVSHAVQSAAKFDAQALHNRHLGDNSVVGTLLINMRRPAS